MWNSIIPRHAKTPETEKKWFHFIDNFKFFLAACIVVSHSIQPYVIPNNPYSYHWFFYDATGPSTLFTLLSYIVRFLGVPGFFLVSGYFAHKALWRVSIGKFLWERFLRVLLPFFLFFPIVVGVSFYFATLSNPYSVGFFRTSSFGIPSLENPGSFILSAISSTQMHPLHLWFLPCLFAFFVILAGFFAWMPRSAIQKIDRACKSPTLLKLVLFGVAISIVWAVLWGGSPPNDWTVFGWFSIRGAYFFNYLFFFFLWVAANKYGYLEKLTKTATVTSLLIGSGIFLLFSIWFVRFEPYGNLATGWYVGWEWLAAFQFVDTFVTLLLMIGIFGIIRQYFDRPFKTASFYVKHSMLVYVLHFPSALLGQYLVFHSPLPLVAKVSFVVFFVFSTTLFFSFLFQMASRKKIFLVLLVSVPIICAGLLAWSALKAPVRPLASAPVITNAISPTITNSELLNAIKWPDSDFIILDVRENDEYVLGHIPESVHIRFADVREWRWTEFLGDKPVYVVCLSGIRSKKITDFLQKKNVKARYLEKWLDGWVAFGGPWQWDAKLEKTYAPGDVLFTAEEVRKRVAEDGALLIDSKTGENAEGIIGVSLVETPSDKVDTKFSQVPKGSKIIVLCYDDVSCFGAKLTGLEFQKRDVEFLWRYKNPSEPR